MNTASRMRKSGGGSVINLSSIRIVGQGNIHVGYNASRVVG